MESVKKLLFIALVGVMSLSGLLAGCSSKQTASTGDKPASGGTLIIGIESEADVLDPHRAGGWVTFRINRQIHESLVTEDLSKPSEEAPVPPLKPGLAESWEVSPDGLKYTFKLRKGVKFHDGTDFNAQAVEFNVRRVWDKNFEYYDARSAGNLNATFQNLKEIHVIDDHTIELIFSKPFSEFLRMLAQGGMGSGGIVSPAALKKWGNDQYAEHPAGTGPFKFEERVRGQKIVLVRNDQYWGQKPHLDKVIFRPIPDAAARVTALETGEVDVIAVPPPDSVESLKSKGFNVVQGTPPHVWYLAFNFNNKYMKDKRVRQAVIMAINRKGMAKDLLKDTANPAYSVQSPGNEAFDPNFVDYEYNPEKAKQLLAEAGYPNGFETTFQTSVDGSGQLIPVPMAEWIQRDLAKIGIKVKIETYEWITYIGVWLQGMKPDVGFNQMSWGFTTPYWLEIAADSKSGTNSGKYNNPKVDQLIEQAMSETDAKKAISNWKDANKIISEDAALAPIVNDKAPYAMAKYVDGFIAPSEEWYDLTQVQLKK
ncbi:ABC transporter substrate-binding protein [Ferviditalea candida]|uniref:ABC transporter substrate-binding protein n=1 Tax=Ferviditalea candida TaxID=3108399 RepID=A0ABU5ZGZ2_9BACL|nr:ABC transporter substrate-binding protein [Paenibacillaceae bacterium T2]